jgi:hypothetical protein
MEKNTRRVVVVSLALVLCLATTTLSQSPPKPAAEPVGAIASSGDTVLVNGATAQRGTTVFSGNEIRTGATATSVHLTSGGGIVSIAPESRVKLIRERDKVIAEVLKGSVTMRSPLTTVVVAPDQTVNSGPNNLYTVSTSDSGSVVESFLKEVAVKAADGAVQTIAPKVPNTLGREATPLQGGVGEPEPITPERGPFIVARCMVTGNTLMVSGSISCNGVAVPGAQVTVSAQVRGFPLLFLRETVTTDESGRYKATFTHDRIPRGGTARLSARTNIASCGVGANSCEF